MQTKPAANTGRPKDAGHLLGVELVELRFAVVLAPETQHLGLGAVRHVDQLLKPPALTDGAGHAPQNQTVITDLYTHSHC